MKKEFFITLLLLLILVGCTKAEESQNKEIVNQQPTIEDPGTGEMIVETGEQNIKEFDMIAKMWEFSPSVIEVNQGDRVILHITSIDVLHGIDIPSYGIDKDLEPNQKVDIEFIADKKGEFEFHCDVFCGSGHSSMKGKLIVN